MAVTVAYALENVASIFREGATHEGVRVPGMIDIAVTYAQGFDGAALASRLALAGMVVDQKLDAIRTITGQIEPHRLADVRSVEGVSDASPIARSFTQG